MDTNTSIETTLKDMWHTRPTRIPKDQGGNAMIAGVCEGIGARYQIDPVIVRIAFVGLTLTFGGGIFIYLLMWMNLPRYGMPTSPWKAINTPKVQLNPQELKERDTGWWLLVGLAIFLPSITVGTGGIAAASVITLFIAAGALYLLHRAHPEPPVGLSVSTSDTTAGPQVDTSHLTTPAGYPHPGAVRITPPSWDPLATVPELWHLPDLPPEHPEASRTQKRGGSDGWLIGLGIAVLAPIAATAATAGGLYFGSRADIGTTYFSATDDLRDSYDTGIGKTTLDLSQLASLEGDRTTTLDHGIGEVTIIPPKNTRVEFTCDEGIGSNNCPPVLSDASSGPTLTLDVNVGIGEISVVGP